MALREAPIPQEGLYRIGRAPDPLAWSPPGGDNRFDDPQGRFRVLYAAEQRRACFVETLAPHRPDLAWLRDHVNRLPDGERGDDTPTVGRIPPDWPTKRRLARFRIAPDQRWLDLRSLETHETLRHQMAATLVDLGYRELDLSDVLSRDRRLTQAIAWWSYDAGYHGLAYKSRYDPAFDCWGIFDTAVIVPLSVEPIATDDADLIWVARLFGLTPPSSSR